MFRACGQVQYCLAPTVGVELVGFPGAIFGREMRRKAVSVRRIADVQWGDVWELRAEVALAVAQQRVIYFS